MNDSLLASLNRIVYIVQTTQEVDGLEAICGYKALYCCILRHRQALRRATENVHNRETVLKCDNFSANIDQIPVATFLFLNDIDYCQYNF